MKRPPPSVYGVSFDVGADAYGRFMGRYSEPLAAKFVALAGVMRGQQAVDVGCGTGALTAELVERLGAEAVSAIDPSESFVEAVRSRLGRITNARPAPCRMDSGMPRLGRMPFLRTRCRKAGGGKFLGIRN